MLPMVLCSGHLVAMGVLSSPYGIALDPWGRVMVADKNNKRVLLISDSGETFDLLGCMNGNPRAILLQGNTLYVSQSASYDLVIYNITYVR